MAMLAVADKHGLLATRRNPSARKDIWPYAPRCKVRVSCRGNKRLKSTLESEARLVKPGRSPRIARHWPLDSTRMRSQLIPDKVARVENQCFWVRDHCDESARHHYETGDCKLRLRSSWIEPSETWKQQCLGITYGDARAVANWFL